MGFEPEAVREAVEVYGTVGASIDWLMREPSGQMKESCTPCFVDRLGAAAPDGLVAGLVEIAGWFDGSAQDSSQLNSVVSAVRGMGFSTEQVSAALQRTSSVEAAVEWLMENDVAHRWWVTTVCPKVCCSAPPFLQVWCSPYLALKAVVRRFVFGGF
mmetsp:Transcript_80961/g.216106  ORF Transcript_80961/g.216106 Transcript_80961/m.216106 type:complete len:157 (-) Transcript_80961:13-483(-)